MEVLWISRAKPYQFLVPLFVTACLQQVWPPPGHILQLHFSSDEKKRAIYFEMNFPTFMLLSRFPARSSGISCCAVQNSLPGNRQGNLSKVIYSCSYITGKAFLKANFVVCVELKYTEWHLSFLVLLLMPLRLIMITTALLNGMLLRLKRLNQVGVIKQPYNRYFCDNAAVVFASLCSCSHRFMQACVERKK